MFDTLSGRLEKVFTSLRGKGRLSEADIDATCREIRIALLEADVALPVVKGFVGAIKERARGEQVSQALNPAQQVIKIVNEELVTILGGQTRRLRLAKNPPTMILLAGLQGAGKTTLAGKLALWLKKQGHTPLLVACDLQRPNAVQQLQVVGQQAGVDVFAPHPGASATGAETWSGTAEGSSEAAAPPGDPVAVARQSVVHATHTMHDVVVVDTAGRLGVDEQMMAQAAAIAEAVRPDETLFVVDAMIGQDAVTTARAFKEGVGFTGVVLTKLDGDARGGAALSVRQVTGEPILFASTGEKLADFDVFHPERMASRILGMGDVLTLIEQAEQVFDADQTEQMAAKLSAGGGDFTLEDFLDQMMAVRKMGPIGNLLGMMPGMGQMKEQIAQIDDKDLDRVAAIIRSMTPGERQDPKIINGSRRVRIATGSGVTVTDVNQLVDRFFDARKMMKQLSGMGLPGMGGVRRSATRTSKNKRKGKKSGRPGGPRRNPDFPPKLPGGAPGPDLGQQMPGQQGSGQQGSGQQGPRQQGPAQLPGGGLPPGFSMPNIDLSKLRQPPRDR